MNLSFIVRASVDEEHDASAIKKEVDLETFWLQYLYCLDTLAILSCSLDMLDDTIQEIHMWQ